MAWHLSFEVCGIEIQNDGYVRVTMRESRGLRPGKQFTLFTVRDHLKDFAIGDSYSIEVTKEQSS